MNRSEIVSAEMDARGWNARDLSKASGVAYTTIRSMLERDFVNASIDNTSKICKALGLSMDDLVQTSREGSMVKESLAEYRSSESLYRYTSAPISAGLPELVEGEHSSSVIAIPDNLMGRYARQKDICMMRINGESMNRVIPHGSLIAVKPVTLENLRDGDIVVYRDCYDYAVKRMYRASDKLIFRPDSHDPSFTDYVTEADEQLDVIGKVVIYIVELV